MKNVIKAASIFVIALCFALTGFFIPRVHVITVGGTYILPSLAAEITSPANGAQMQVGNCFDVTATITPICGLADQSFNRDSVFIKPVQAINGCEVHNAGATIAITGSASLQEAATKYTGGGLSCYDQGACPTSATISWRVCCTGPGQVTITVTPYGESYAYTQAPSVTVQPVYAIPVEYTPIPSNRLVSDSITITQIAQRDFYNNVLMDSGGASMGTDHYVRATNVWAQPQTLEAGQKVIIYANMANRGDIEGPYTATLKINGVEEAVKTGILQGNTAVPLEFTIIRNEPGTYQVDVNGKVTFFTVIGNNNEEKATSKNIQNLLFLWGFLILALVIALTVLILRRRQSYN